MVEQQQESQDARISQMMEHVTNHPFQRIVFFSEKYKERSINPVQVMIYLMTEGLLEAGEYRIFHDEENKQESIEYHPTGKKAPVNIMKILEENNFLVTVGKGRSQNKFVTYKGLLYVATKYSRVDSIVSEMVESQSSEKGYVFKTIITGSRGTFSDYGDATVRNTKPNMVSTMLRIASTRSIVRALRLYLGVGLCGMEELGDYDPDTPTEVDTTPVQTDI